jgi:hypothetical protein
MLTADRSPKFSNRWRRLVFSSQKIGLKSQMFWIDRGLGLVATQKGRPSFITKKFASPENPGANAGLFWLSFVS